MIKKISVLLILAMFSVTLSLSAKDIKKIEVKTSSECGMCKTAIEKAVNKLSGIESVELVVETKIAKVAYDAEATSPDKIRKAINLAGYDADDTKADPKAYRKLPKCCQKGGHK